jgi:hypothetical protein
LNRADVVDLATKAALSLASGAAGWVAKGVVDWRRPILFNSSNWKYRYEHRGSNGFCYFRDAPPSNAARGRVRFSFDVRIFNKKSRTIGLHRLAVEFTRGPWYRRTAVRRTERLRHAGEPLREMALPSHDWAVRDVRGSLDDAPVRPDADRVWLTAEGAEGKRFRWRITELGPAPPPAAA